MDTTLRTLLTMAATDTDVAAMVLAGTLLPFMLGTSVALGCSWPSSPRPSRVWQEGERHLDPRPARWHAAHRAGSPRVPPGAHQPGRGRYARKARQAQLEERTVAVDRRAFLGKP